MLRCSFKLALFSLLLFFCRQWTHWFFNDPSHFFSKSQSRYYASSTKSKLFSIGKCVHLWVEWLGKRASWAGPEERSNKLQRGARIPGQRRAGQLVVTIKCVCPSFWTDRLSSPHYLTQKDQTTDLCVMKVWPKPHSVLHHLSHNVIEFIAETFMKHISEKSGVLFLRGL